MPHLDEGVLQAWLDRPRSGMEASEAESVERHLAECEACAGRLAELEGLTERTRSILASGAPAETAIPAFETIVGGGRGAGTGAAGASADGRRRLDRLTSLAWAASVVVALGLGWATNDLVRGPGRRFGEPAAEVAMAPSQRGENTPAAAERQAAPAAEQGSASAASSEADAAAPEQVAGGVAEPVVERELAAAPQAEPAPPEEPRLADALPAPAPATPQAALMAQARADAARPANATVRGRVIDRDTGEPVASAQVVLPDRDLGVLSRQDGSFSLDVPLPADSVEVASTLAAQRLGFGDVDRRVALKAGETIRAELRLSQSALQLDEVIMAPDTGRRQALGNAAAGAPSGAAAPSAAADAVSAADAGAPVLSFPPDAGWTVVSQATATERAGFAPLLVQDLEVLEIGVAELGGTSAVRILQQTASGTVVTLVERRGTRVPEDRREDDGTVSVSALRGDVVVTASGALSAEALRGILDEVR